MPHGVKALLKSNDITITYGFDCSKSVTLLSNEMIAADVDPEGRNANWSKKVSDGGGVRKAGYKNSRTTARSIILVNIGVTDI